MAKKEPTSEPVEPSTGQSLQTVDEVDSDVENLMAEQRQVLQEEDGLTLIQKVYQLWWRWADFEILIVQPTFQSIFPPKIILPETLPNNAGVEFVYPIHDYGYRLTTSKALDMYDSGMSMCKLHYTIEKMIFLFVERLKEGGGTEGGVTSNTEIQISFGGHELAQRKGFEAIINLNYNVVVSNFDPGPWGEEYLRIVKGLAEKGYGYPQESPRDTYRHHPFIGISSGKR